MMGRIGTTMTGTSSGCCYSFSSYFHIGDHVLDEISDRQMHEGVDGWFFSRYPELESSSSLKQFFAQYGSPLMLLHA